eukprot:gene17477-57907_t
MADAGDEEREAAFLRTRIATLEQVVDSEGTRVEQLATALRLSQQQLDDMSRRAAAAEAERRRQRAYLDQLGEGAAERDAEVEALRDRVATARAEVEAREEAVAALRTKVHEQELRTARWGTGLIEEAMLAQKVRVEDIAAAIEAARRDIAAVENECEQLEAEPDMSHARIGELRKLIDDLKDAVATTQRDRKA